MQGGLMLLPLLYVLAVTAKDEGSCFKACLNLVTTMKGSAKKGCTLSNDERWPNDERGECKRRCVDIVKNNCSTPGSCSFQITQKTLSPPVIEYLEFTTIALRWNFSVKPLFYVLHAESNEVQSNTLEILPSIPKYYFVNGSNVSKPVIFLVKNLLAETKYKFRVAAVNHDGVTDYSKWSEWYETNNKCNRTSGSVPLIHSPCPVTHVKLNVSLKIVEKKPVVLDATLSWWFSRDNTTGKGLISVKVALLKHVNSTLQRICNHHHNSDFSHYVLITSGEKAMVNLFNSPSNSGPRNSIHFGCRYSVKFKLLTNNGNDGTTSLDSTTIFHIPECLDGIRSCPIPSFNHHTSGDVSSQHIDIKIKPEPMGNYTSQITWSLQAWSDSPTVEFFHITIEEWPYDPITNFYFTDDVATIKGSSEYHITSKNMSAGRGYRVVIRAYHGENCIHGKVERETFEIWKPCEEGCNSNETCFPSNTYDGSAMCKCKSGFKRNGSICIVSEPPTQNTAAQKSAIKNTSVTIIVVPLVVIVAIVLLLGLLYWKRRQKRKRIANNIFNSIRIHGSRPSTMSNSNLYQHYPSMSDGDFPAKIVDLPEEREANVIYVPQEIQHAIACGLTDGYELSAEKLKIGARLGKGAFGNVYCAEAQGIGTDPTEWTYVAVKTLSSCKTMHKYVDEFIEEIELMKKLGVHENVITMLGCCTLSLPICLILEYAPYGNLRDYLRTLRNKLEKSIKLKNINEDTKDENTSQENEVMSIEEENNEDVKSSPKASEKTEDTNIVNGQLNERLCIDGVLDPSELESFALQIANGMAYVAGCGIVHRDLAARNVLIGQDRILKISDFGLSREGVYVKTTSGKIPLRWLSVEAIRERLYSSASDVWAFGIVLWEICTLGGFPYPMISDKDLLTFLGNGKRLEKPKNCTDEIYSIMLQCWRYAPKERPTFGNLRDMLWKLKKCENPYVNIDPLEGFNFPPMAEDSSDEDRSPEFLSSTDTLPGPESELEGKTEDDHVGFTNPVFPIRTNSASSDSNDSLNKEKGDESTKESKEDVTL